MGQIKVKGRALAFLAFDIDLSHRQRDTILWTNVRPSPVPRPGGLVVKNGSKILSSTSRLMPWPVSRTLK